MRDPIEAVEDALLEVDAFKGWVEELVDNAFAHYFGIKHKSKRRAVFEAMGGLPGVIRMLAAMKMPKGFTPYRIEAQAPMFEPMKTKGREAVKATVVIEILCLKEDTDGQ